MHSLCTLLFLRSGCAWLKAARDVFQQPARLFGSHQATSMIQPLQTVGNNMPNPFDSLWGTVIISVIATIALYQVALWLTGG